MTSLLAIDANLSGVEPLGCSGPYSGRYESVCVRTDTLPASLKLQMIASQKGTTKLYISFQECTANDALFSAAWANATAADPQFQYTAKKLWIDDASNRRVEKLTDIQSTLGVSTQLFAQMLGISRAQLYKWLDPHRSIELQLASSKRIASLERLARLWRATSPAPLNPVLDEPVSDGATSRDLLTAEEIDEARIENAFRTLPQTLASQPQTLSQKMVAAGFRSRRATHLPDDE